MAPLPESDRGMIDERKLRDYLLSPTHPIGRFKSEFFTRLGYTQSEWTRLAADLRRDHLPHEAEAVGSTQHGVKYRIVAPLVGPTGEKVQLVSIWIVRTGERRPRFVTAHPGG